MSVPGQGLDHVSGLAAEGAGHGVSGPVCVVAVGKGHRQGLAAQALHEGRYRGAVAGADDQVALPVAGLAAVTRGGGALADGPEIAQRAGLCCAAASGLSASAAPRQAPPGALGRVGASAFRVCDSSARLAEEWMEHHYNIPERYVSVTC